MAATRILRPVFAAGRDTSGVLLSAFVCSCPCNVSAPNCVELATTKSWTRKNYKSRGFFGQFDLEIYFVSPHVQQGARIRYSFDLVFLWGETYGQSI